MKVEPGTEFRHRFSYTQEQVNLFAQVTGDTNPLHLDEEYAKNTMFGKRIIHGFLGGAVFTRIFGTLFCADGNVYISQEMKFMRPMYVDTEYEAVITVKQIISEKNQAVFDCKITDAATGKITTVGEAVLMNKKYFV